MDNNCANDGFIEQYASMSSATVACKRKERNFFFYFMFSKKKNFFFFFFFQSCYKGYSLHGCKLKNTWECTTHMLTLKPMYKESKCTWGCITWCSTTSKPCVCMCMLPRPKAGSKTSFGVARFFLPPKLRNSELHGLLFIFSVPSPTLALLLIMVVVVLVVAVVQK
jgi:hypothetical protein